MAGRKNNLLNPLYMAVMSNMTGSAVIFVSARYLHQSIFAVQSISCTRSAQHTASGTLVAFICPVVNLQCGLYVRLKTRQNKRIVIMKPRVNKNSLRPLLILVVMLLFPLETAFAQDNAENVTVSAQIETRENPDTHMPHRNVAKPGLEKKEADLLNELIQPEPANKSDQTVKEDSCTSIKCTLDIPQ